MQGKAYPSSGRRFEQVRQISSNMRTKAGVGETGECWAGTRRESKKTRKGKEEQDRQLNMAGTEWKCHE